MTTPFNPEHCSCDESKAWRTRALAAELSLRYARGQLRRLLEHFDRVLDEMPGEDLETPEGVLGATHRADEPLRDADSIWKLGKVVDWMLLRVRGDGSPKSERP